MTRGDSPDLRSLLDRLVRLAGTEAWAGHLTPTQIAALDYLWRANRFSRAPSHVADYLGATRGTISQTLRTLERRGLIREVRDTADRRRIRYDVTDDGSAALQGNDTFDQALGVLSATQRAQLAHMVQTLLSELVHMRGGRGFGLCNSCRHLRQQDGGYFCAMLNLPLEPFETKQLCHEHEGAAA